MEDDPFITSPKPPSLTQDEPEGEQPQNLARNSTSQAENNKAKKRRSVTFTEDTRNDAVNNTHPRGKSPVRRETNEVHVSVGDTSSPASAKLTDRRDADVNGARDERWWARQLLNSVLLKRRIRKTSHIPLLQNSKLFVCNVTQKNEMETEITL